MLNLFPPPRPILLGMLALQAMCVLGQSQPSPKQNLFPGVSATPAITNFPGISATPTAAAFPGFAASGMGTIPLTAPPAVLALPHVESADMDSADTAVVSRLRAVISTEAARTNFDISEPAWHYQQIVCAAFPDYVFLAFTHGPEVEGSSRFVAVLPREGSEVRIVSAYAHGLLPFAASWSRPGSFETFNKLLRRERGRTALSYAPNWLLIGMSFAEVAGYPVQVPTTAPLAEPTLDLLRLGANRPQLLIAPDKSASITFSDVSRPETTTNWTLRFNQEGEIIGAGRELARQPTAIALKP